MPNMHGWINLLVGNDTHFVYLHNGGYVFSHVCLLVYVYVDRITQKLLKKPARAFFSLFLDWPADWHLLFAAFTRNLSLTHSVNTHADMLIYTIGHRPMGSQDQAAPGLNQKNILKRDRKEPLQISTKHVHSNQPAKLPQRVTKQPRQHNAIRSRMTERHQAMIKKCHMSTYICTV